MLAQSAGSQTVRGQTCRDWRQVVLRLNTTTCGSDRMGNRSSSHPHYRGPWVLQGPHPQGHQLYGGPPPPPSQKYGPASGPWGPDECPPEARHVRMRSHQNGPSPAHMRRSVMSLNLDSGFVSNHTDGGSGEREKRISRMSLNEFAFDRPIIIPDMKTLKKLEKKQKKMMKKMGAKGVPAAFVPMQPQNLHAQFHPSPMSHPMPHTAPMPHRVPRHHMERAQVPDLGHAPLPDSARSRPPPQQFTQFPRTISYDDLCRRPTLDVAPPPDRDWYRRRNNVPKMGNPVVHSSSSTAVMTSLGRGSVESSSPVTSSSSSRPSSERWRDQTSRASMTIEHPEERRIPVRIVPASVRSPTTSSPRSPPLYEGKPTVVTPQARAVLERNSRVFQTQTTTTRRESMYSNLPSNQDDRDTVDTKTTSSLYSKPRFRDSRPQSSGFSSCGSSISGVPRGDQSEIDFSWVRDEERRLNKQNMKNAKSLPECYFGMEPPKVGGETAMSRKSSSNESLPDANVRLKTAFFEEEARNAERIRREHKLENAARSLSNPHLLDDDQGVRDVDRNLLSPPLRDPNQRRNQTREAVRQLGDLKARPQASGLADQLKREQEQRKIYRASVAY